MCQDEDENETENESFLDYACDEQTKPLVLLIIKDTEKYYLGRLLLWNYKA